MAIYEPYIPKEHLALQINYCKQQLAELPEVKASKRTKNGSIYEVFVVGKHFYQQNSEKGKELEAICYRREELLCELSRLEGLWNSSFRGVPSPCFSPRNLKRKMFINPNNSVILNGDFFDSLKNDADPNHREIKTYFYNGIYYRSASEVEIARYYTENGIPFKYEPEIWLNGLNYPIYTDFVILIKALDLCKFHEHIGIKNSANYNRTTSTKYINYSGAGLLPELDVFFTYDIPGVPFDLRTLPIKLNSVVYSSLFLPDTPFL